MTGANMTANEFLSLMKSRGATTYDACTPRDIELANVSLQSRRHAVLPPTMRELYMNSCGLNLGSGYIFGPKIIERISSYPIPDIVQVNNDFGHTDANDGKTVFGRNDLFLFAFDAFGVFYMLDNLTLRVLKKYDDAYRALSDCLMGGHV